MSDYWGRKKRERYVPDAEEVVSRIFESSDYKCQQLFRDGDLTAYRGLRNRAEFALCLKLAFWTEKNKRLMAEVFCQSALYVPERWERLYLSGERHGEQFIRKACAAQRATFEWYRLV